MKTFTIGLNLYNQPVANPGILAHPYNKRGKKRMGLLLSNNPTKHFPILNPNGTEITINTNQQLIIHQLILNYNQDKNPISGRLEDISKCSESNKCFIYFIPTYGHGALDVIHVSDKSTHNFRPPCFIVAKVRDTIILLHNETKNYSYEFTGYNLIRL